MEKGGAKHLVLCVGPPFCTPGAVASVDNATPGEALASGFQGIPWQNCEQTETQKRHLKHHLHCNLHVVWRDLLHTIHHSED